MELVEVDLLAAQAPQAAVQSGPQMLGAPEVILTRAAKIGGAPTAPSR